MLKLFKRPATKSMNEIIEEIHESFYTEVDKLLAEAKIAKSLDSDKQHLIEKRSRLKALGFHSTKEVLEADEEIARLSKVKEENKAKETLTEVINYFSFKYPTYKFITEESVKKICEKYSLVYGPIEKYIGAVPDTNLEHIENFKISKDDECFITEKYYYSSFYNHNRTALEFNYTNAEKHKKDLNSPFDPDSPFRYEYKKCALEIAAPLKDFNMSQSEVRAFKISERVIPDPVVLKPVYFKGNKYYLIVTAWGLEASDPLVLNTKHN